MAVYLPNISSVDVKVGLMSSKVRLDIARYSVSLTIGFDNSNFQSLLRISKFELIGLHCIIQTL